MRALTVLPTKSGSARVADVPEPPPSEGDIIVAPHWVGVCGTDADILEGKYGSAPPGEAHLILGHESIGKVVDAPRGSTLKVGDWVVGIVRMPDPEPCSNCAVGEWDMCRNNGYTEHGIKQLHGFMRERYRSSERFLVKVDPALGELGVLIEPTSVVAKAWEHIERIGSRARFEPKVVLVTGAGPIGILAALLGRQRGLDVHVLDRHRDGPKPELVKAMGATYHLDMAHVPDPDLVIECTGAAALVFEVMHRVSPGGIVCLTGISAGGRKLPIDLAALNRELVLENNVIFGSVNANRRHYESAAAALCSADKSFLERIISRTVPIAKFNEALEKQPTDIKVAVTFAS